MIGAFIDSSYSMKVKLIFPIVICMVIAVIFSSITMQAKDLPKLEIIRKAEAVEIKPRDKKSMDPEVIISRKYSVAPTFLSNDVFASNINLRRRSAKHILEAAGILFPAGTAAIYNPDTSLLTVNQTSGELAKIEVFLEKIRGEVNITFNFHFEIFRLPGPLAQELLKRSEQGQQNSLQRARVATWQDKNQGELIKIIKLQVDENQSAEMAEGREYRAIKKYSWDKTSKQMMPLVESSNVGTSVSINSPVLQGDSLITFEYSFEHDFAEPTVKNKHLHFPNSTKTVSVELAEYHKAKFASDKKMTLKINEVKLLGSYPVVIHNDDKKGMMEFVFLQASLEKIKRKKYSQKP